MLSPLETGDLHFPGQRRTIGFVVSMRRRNWIDGKSPSPGPLALPKPTGGTGSALVGSVLKAANKGGFMIESSYGSMSAASRRKTRLAPGSLVRVMVMSSGSGPFSVMEIPTPESSGSGVSAPIATFCQPARELLH